jgi:TetR/AcrR family transcriptional regulator, transcriptional repressor for nem operon
VKDEIKKLATDLLIRHGYRGFRFSDISDTLEMTRPNVHYHFGTKTKLIEEVICEYVDATFARLETIWRSEDFYTNKVLATMEFNRLRYLHANPKGNSNNPWSLISRMRLESDLLTEPSKKRLRRFSEQIDSLIGDAVHRAEESKEFTKRAPIRDIQLQIVIIVDSAGSITTDAGSFTRLEQLYLAHLRLVALGYGSQRIPSALASERIAR